MFVETAKKMPEYTFVWVGKIPQLEFLQNKKEIEQIYYKNKTKNLIFTGGLFGDDLVQALYSADMFWLPSHAETFGIVIAEAAACGLPVLVRDLPVYKVFDDFAVRHSEIGGKESPEKKIRELFKNKNKLRKLSRLAKKASLKYDTNKHVDKLLSEYKKTIDLKKSKAIAINKIKTKKPFVSIIVPTLNEKKFVGECLKALLNQTINKKFYEIIVSDSSSSDNTVKIAKKYADKVVVCKRKSAGFGRNCGAKLAKGKFLAFVDADTVVQKTFVEGVIEGLEKSVVCTGPIEPLDDDSLAIKSYYAWWSIQNFVSIKANYPIVPGFNFAVRKNVFEKEKGFNPDITVEDIELALRLKKHGKVGYNNNMKVKSSARRLKEMGIMKYTTNGINFMLFGKSWSWDKHRKDMKK